MAFSLTSEQQAAVDNRGGGLLVSAAAGSGKTRVLVERLLARVEGEGLDIDRFLVITYTKAAAAELRGRIVEELSARLAESKLAVARAELARLQEQVALLEPTAQKYEELKDRVATVELDAHRKAQATVDEAQAQVEAMKEGAQQWISGILGQYDQLRQAVDELDRRLQAVGSLAAGMSGGDEGANRLRQWGGVE